MSFRLFFAFWLVLSLTLLWVAGRWVYSELHFYQASKLLSQVGQSVEPVSHAVVDVIDYSLNQYNHYAWITRPAYYDLKIGLSVFRLELDIEPDSQAEVIEQIKTLLAEQTLAFPHYPFVWVNNLRLLTLTKDSSSVDYFWDQSLFLAHRNPLVNLELALTINDIWSFLDREQRAEALEVLALGFSATRHNARKIYRSLTDQNARMATCLYLNAKQVLNADVCQGR
ncbi:hypothetical protein P8S54_09530 [Thiomicrospira sp. R3]|uniref:hypothetical protein n=1 Tax=Thiomicrospira sp. R3 TaxID=3035472 RepID=UPI00259B8521|nr:hypothetical protein [Thiomicrospira sp. R3]WFE68436.1 hypothetical protein P8S54_09530 [Thiomicrospira sp. R3]